MKTKKKVAIYIGRFEPAHNGHVETFKYCNKNYDRTLVLIGSKNKRRTLKNPFPVEMVRNWVLENSDRSTQTFAINDYLYSDNKWIAQIEDLVYSIYNKEGFPKYFMFGGLDLAAEIQQYRNLPFNSGFYDFFKIA